MGERAVVVSLTTQDNESWHQVPYIIVPVSFLFVLASSQKVNKSSLNKGQISAGVGTRLQIAVYRGKEKAFGRQQRQGSTLCNLLQYFCSGGLVTGKMKGQETGNSIILTLSAFHRIFK